MYYNFNIPLTCPLKDVSEDVIWNLFTTFNHLDSLLDTVSTYCSDGPSYFPVLCCFEWMVVLQCKI